MLKLDEVLLHRHSLAPKQSAYQGTNPLQMSRSAVKNMSRAYNAAITTPSRSTALPEHVQAVFDQHVSAAQSTGQPQLAQTWDIVAFSTGRHLHRRLQSHRGPTAEQCKVEQKLDLRKSIQTVLQRTKSPATSPAMSPASIRPVSSIAQALAGTDSNSNATTPLARALPNDRHVGTSNLHAPLPDPESDQDLAPLPPSLTLASEHDKHLSVNIQGLQPSEAQLTQENLLAMQSQRTTPMPIDYSNSHPWPDFSSKADRNDRPPPVRPSLLKHDSDESFSFLVGSASSRDVSIPNSYDTSDVRPSSMVKEHLTRPLLRINSESPKLGDVEDDNVSPIEQAVVASSSSHHSDHNDDSAVQTIQQSATLDKHDPAHKDVLELVDSSQLDVETGEPFQLSEMLKELVNYYTISAPSAQTAAQMMLLLGPLLPTGSPLDKDLAEAILTTYIESINGAADIVDVLNKAFSHLMNAGLNPLQIESILSTYHEQLLANQMYTEAANLRKLAYPAFPAVYEYGLGADNLTLSCGRCGKRLITTHGQLQCASCSTRQPSCTICLTSSSPFGTSMGGNLITACLLCNHSTHAGCAEEWFRALGGKGCPLEGCLCTCVV